WEGMTHLAQDLASVLFHHRSGVALKGMAEGVVGGEEEPGVAARLDDGIARTVGQGPGVVGPMYGVGCTGLPGQIGGGGTGDEKDFVPFLGDVVDGECYRGGRHIDHDVDFVDVVPLADDVGADVGLVLVVSEYDLDLVMAGRRLAEVLDRLARGPHG